MGNSSSAPETPEDLSFYSTAEQVVDLFDGECDGKTIVVTGANTGLGLETARCLASKGATVVIACRTPSKGEAAVASITAAHPSAKVSFLPLDLASFASIRAFATAFTAQFDRLDILINNAGVMACPKTLTADGLETQFGVNHMGHFYLTKLLLPTLQRTGTAHTPARVIALSSLAQFTYAPPGGILFDDLAAEKTYYTWERYGQGKLANLLFAQELTRRYAAQHVIAVALHPGVIPTSELLRFTGLGNAISSLTGMRSGTLFRMMSEGVKSIAQGAATTVTAALSPKIVPGGYYADCQLSKDVHPTALDGVTAAKLWDVSDQLVHDIEAKLPAQ